MLTRERKRGRASLFSEEEVTDSFYRLKVGQFRLSDS